MKLAAAIVSLVIGAACAREDTGSATAVRDSAGVQIIESRGPAWDTSAQWRIVEEPMLSIGSSDGSADYQFARIVGATRLQDGTIVVGDAGSNSICFFDSTGQLVRSVGRRGKGPGEFQSMQSLRRQGESIDVYDRRLGRMTVFDRSGAVVQTLQVLNPGVAMHRLTSGRWLVAEEEGFYGGRFRENVTSGLHRFPSLAMVVDSSGGVVDTIGAFPGAEAAYFLLNGQVGSMPAAYGRTLTFASSGGEAYVVTGQLFGFDVYDPGGRRTRSVRLRDDGSPVRKEDVEQFNQALVGDITDSAQREGFRRALELAAVPPTKSPTGRVLVDGSGYVWLGAYENEYMPALTWHVFARDGQFLGTVQNVSGLRILEVGDRHVLGIVRNDDGVEVVRLHELRRPGG